MGLFEQVGLCFSLHVCEVGVGLPVSDTLDLVVA